MLNPNGNVICSQKYVLFCLILFCCVSSFFIGELNDLIYLRICFDVLSVALVYCQEQFFVLFIFDIFVLSLGCLVLYYKHVRLLDLSFLSVALFSVLLRSRLGFLYKPAHICGQHTRTSQSMRTHAVDLHAQASACAHIPLPRNPNSSFFTSFPCLFYMLCFCFNHFSQIQVTQFA